MYYTELKKQWKAKINKHDPLKEAKHDAIEVALGLGYPTETFELIVVATKETEITRALYNARRTA